MAKRTQTTVSFDHKAAAITFKSWLKNNEMNQDYGAAKFIDLLQVSNHQWCVEFSYDTKQEFAIGVAHGIHSMRVALEAGLQVA